jgi:D-alanine-D-alanine ligase
MTSNVLILVGADPKSPRIDERESYIQAHAVAQSLHNLGYDSEIIHVTTDLDFLTKIRSNKPFFVINLVEELDNSCNLAPIIPAFLENYTISYSGASALNYALTSNKLETKRILQLAQLPTPEWSDDGLDFWGDNLVIIKSVSEDASFGIDENSLVKARDAAQALRLKTELLGGQWFAENYIKGREFNLSLMHIDNKIKIFPAAELVFSNYPEHKAHILDYESKWDAESFSYNNITRQFLPHDDALSQRLGHLALKAWQALNLRGYARVDFRVAADGQIFILEVNVNPSLAPDAGFAAAAAQLGINYDNLIKLLLPKNKLQNTQDLCVEYRPHVKAADIAATKTILSESDFFTDEEVEVAVELLESGLKSGVASGYHFMMAESLGALLGYACYGRIMSTEDRYDLYWLAVQPNLRRQGLGHELLKRVEKSIITSGGQRIYVQTAGRALYEPTHAFYIASGYSKIAVLPDYYGPGDDQVIFMKELVK